MAKATLPTNYRDDILNVSTEGKRKYRMNYNDDGTVSFVDVTPYDQEGSDFGAGDINATNEAVNQSFDKSKLIRDMDAISALTQEGYAPDALALKEVNNSLTANSTQFYFDYQDGKYGYNTDPNRGADTFIPFSGTLYSEFAYEQLSTTAEVSKSITHIAEKDETITVVQHAELYYTGASGSYDYVPLTVTVNDVEQELNYILNYPKYRNMAFTTISVKKGDIITATSKVIKISSKYNKFVFVGIIHN